MIYINCLCITLICVIIIDVFNAFGEISKSVFSLLSGGKINVPIKGKIFYCSTCMSFWTNLIYLICVGAVSIPNILYITALSFSTNILKETLLTLEDKIINLIRKI